MRNKIEERTFFPWSVKEPLLKETGGRCAHCGTPLDRYTNLTVDHIIPLNKGGTNDPENLTVLCEDCNLKKSDMILPPKIWYPYLTESRKKALDAYMTDYIQKTDYLAEDCLMPIDTFRLEVPVVTKKRLPNGYIKTIRMPAYLQGIRMTRDDAFAWLMDYKKGLQYRDTLGLIDHPSQFRAPCYLLKKGNIEIAMANPWMSHKYDPKLKNYKNEIFLDWYFSPDLPDRDYLPEMLAAMVMGLQAFVFRSLAGSMNGCACAILVHTRCFLSDRFCKPVFDQLTNHRLDKVVSFGKNERNLSRIRELSNFCIAGERDACRRLEKELDAKFEEGGISIEDAVEFCAELNRRLANEGS